MIAVKSFLKVGDNPVPYSVPDVVDVKGAGDGAGRAMAGTRCTR